MALTKEQLMKKSVEDLINLIISLQEKNEGLRKKYDAQRKVSSSKELREENKTLKEKVKRYEKMIKKIGMEYFAMPN
jgi:flagellar basal body-associated protein FliL